MQSDISHLILSYTSALKINKTIWVYDSCLVFFGCQFCPLWDEANSVTINNKWNKKTYAVLQFSSVTQSCPTLCDPMNCSTPGLPVHHQLSEFTQTHVHRVGDAIQPSHPLLSPSPPAPKPSQHHGFFQWVNSSHEVEKVLEFQLQHQSFQWTPRTDLRQDGLVWSPHSALYPIFSQEMKLVIVLIIIDE